MNIKLFAGAAVSSLAMATSVYAQTEIQWWHNFTGRNGELLAEQAEKFNASQADYVVVPTHKGNYSEVLNAGIAAFRAGEQPHMMNVFEVGTATMMAAKGAIKPLFEVMAEGGAEFNPDGYLGAVKGYYTTTDGEMLSLPYNSSTPVLWVNRDAMKEAGLDPDMDLTTWQKFGDALDTLKAAGHECPFTTAWQSWIHLENLSAYHNVAFATEENGFSGLNTELSFNGPVQIQHIQAIGDWAKDGKFIYAGRRNEGGANFIGGECVFFTESSAGYASISTGAEFDFGIRPLPYWEGVEGAPQNTIIGGASIWVMAGHEPEEYQGVSQFLSFLSTPEIQSDWHKNTGYLPITMAAAELTKSEGFYEANPGTEIAGMQMTAKPPTADSKGLRLGYFDQIRGIIDEELEAVWAGDKTAEEALNSAIERGDPLLRRFEQANR